MRNLAQAGQVGQLLWSSPCLPRRPSPHQWAVLSLHFLGLRASQAILPGPPGDMHTTAAHASSTVSRQPVLEGAWRQVPPRSTGSWSRETGSDRQPLAAFSFPLWDSGFGESQVVYLLCAAATPSRAPFCLPVTPSGHRAMGVSLWSSFVFLHGEASHPL